ncbi:MAG: virulence RhuM family protein [Bacteroidales bacterium]|nr:virulence RhuM family protein [Bacteroidales bacterium]
MKKSGISESSATGNGEIVIYQPDEVMKLEVRVDGDTVWLTQAQMSDLFDRDRTVITKHIRNIFSEMELDEKSNVHFLHFANSDKPVKLFSLDVIISVGYRVKSIQGTRFRQWANKILKEYLYRGYCLNSRLTAIEHRLDDHEKKIDFFVRTSLPPIEGIFYNGQIFDAYVFVSDLIKSARKSIILIDNYIDESVLLMLSKRSEGVSAEIRTGRMSESLQLDIRKHNNQYEPIRLLQTPDIHDRFLIIDTDIYHIGASLKDLGKKLFAFSKMSIDLDRLI